MPTPAILIVHNRYQHGGGEDAVVQAERILLARHGVEVEILSFSNEHLHDEASPPAKCRHAIRSIWSSNARSEAINFIASSKGKEKIVHVHNFFPTASPSIYSAARSQGAAVVQTLHNYRLLCPNALFFRDGHVCEECMGKLVPWPGVLHACYRDSHAATGVTAAMLTVHGARRTWHKEVDVFIAPTEFARQKFIDGGLPNERIIVKPNLIDRPESPARREGRHFLFVGRLVDYKGASLLLAAWKFLSEPPPLYIAGDGPDREAVATASAGQTAISMLGAISSYQVQQQMSGSLALVVPSLSYETFGIVVVEAFASGLPVIASHLGAMAEIVDDGRTGLLFEQGNAADLATKVRWAADHPHEMAQMGANARAEYEAKYTADVNYRQLIAVYEQAIQIRRFRPNSHQCRRNSLA